MTNPEATHPRRPRHRRIVATVALATLVASGLLAWRLVQPSNAPSITGGGSGPTVWYEVLDADGALLYERRLDGRSLARLVIERRSTDYGSTFSVHPAGVAIARTPAVDGLTYEGIDLATGGVRWSTPGPRADVDSEVWSEDGRLWAALVATDDGEAAAVLVVDVVAGSTTRIDVPARQWPLGFTPTRQLVLAERQEDASGRTAGWRFLVVDPRTREVGRAAGLPVAGPHSSAGDDVAPRQGIAVSHVGPDNDGEGEGDGVNVLDLARGTSQIVARFASIQRIGLTPLADAITVEADGELLTVALDGTVTELFDGADYGTFFWAAAGDFLGHSGYDGRSILTVVERATGRAVELPLPDRIAEAHLLAIAGGTPLPAVPLPPVLAEPRPTASPSGSPVAGAPAILVGWIDRRDDVAVIHVERRAPTDAGGFEAEAMMPDLLVPNLPDFSSIVLLPRPGGDDVLLRLVAGAASETLLWDGGDRRRRLTFPAGWPSASTELAWSPDGGSIATIGMVPGAAPDAPASIAVTDLNGADLVTFPLPQDYPMLAGWPAADTLVLGHAVCTEGCPGRYALSAAFDLRDGTTTELATAASGAIPYLYLDRAGSLVATFVNEAVDDDVHIAWPAPLPALDRGYEAQWLGGTSGLYVSVPTLDDIVVYRLDDPLERARGGRLADPEAVLVGRLPAGSLGIGIARGGQWAWAGDRVGGMTLVELASGRAWELATEPGQAFVWLPAG